MTDKCVVCLLFDLGVQATKSRKKAAATAVIPNKLICYITT